MKNVLVAGCGYVGSALARRLVEDGHVVWGLSRHPDDLPDEVGPLAADLTDPTSLKGLPRRFDRVVYAASADRMDDEAYRAAYVEGPRNLLAALEDQDHEPDRVLFVSSTSVWGVTDGSRVDEDTPTDPRSFRGRRLLEGEDVVRSGPWPATVLRLAGIYGPGRTRLVEKVRTGEAVVREGPPRWTNRIHRDDAASALHRLGELEDPAEVYVGVDDEPADRAEVLAWLADRLGVELAREPAEEGRPRGKRCSNDRLRATGWKPAYPTFREGYQEIIE